LATDFCLTFCDQRPKSTASPGALVALAMPYNVLPSHLIDRLVCNQRDGIGLPVEFGCSSKPLRGSSQKRVVHGTTG
jgi:hypothetical protein